MMNKGFTIIETLVAIAILVAVIVGATGAVQAGISSYIYSKDQIVAFYLAQESFEQVRNLRDENRLAGRNWLYGFTQNSGDPCYFGNACASDAITATLERCPAVGNCPAVRQNATTGFYGLDDSWSPTIFEREITITSIGSDEVAVMVTISWNKGIVSRQFKAREHLLNW